MFVLRSTLLLVIVAAFAPAVEAQLFRFRRPVQQLPQQAPANFNAAAYRYAPAQTSVTNVPSQRYVQQRQQQVVVQQRAQQNPQCRQRIVYVPAQQQTVQTVQQQAVQPLNQPASQQVVMLNVRDPYSGRVVRRPYVVTRRNPQLAQQQQLLAQQTVPVPQLAQGGEVVSLESPQTVLSPEAPNSVVTPVLEPESTEKIATTSFDSPADESAPSNFSVLDNGEENEAELEIETSKEAMPQLDLEVEPATLESPVTPEVPAATEAAPETAEPATETAGPGTLELDLPKANVETEEAGGLKLDSDGKFDLDLPPLGSDGT